MRLKRILESIPEEDKTNPTVMLLLEIIKQQAEEIQLLKVEISRLKGNNPKPKIKPSTL